MRALKSVARHQDESQRLIRRPQLVEDRMMQVSAGSILHHNEKPLLILSLWLIDGNDGRMIERRHARSALEESLQLLIISCDIWVKDFNRNYVLLKSVYCFPDCREATGASNFSELIAASLKIVATLESSALSKL